MRVNFIGSLFVLAVAYLLTVAIPLPVPGHAYPSPAYPLPATPVPLMLPVLVRLPAPVATTTPTTTPASSPTPTPSPPEPTVPPPDTIAGVPVCDDHNPTRWHGAVRWDASGDYADYVTGRRFACTYGHEHKDDPQEADSLFGPAGEWFGGAAISYPWHTPMEDTHKHEMYAYLVRRDLSPLSLSSNYLSAFRIQGHFLGSGGFLPEHPGMVAGFQAENHSFAIEARVCNRAGQCGILRAGGWQDYGKGVIDSSTPTQCAIPDSDPAIGCDTLLRRVHGSPGTTRRDFTWYGSNNRFHGNGQPAIRVGVSIIGDAWAAVDPNDFNALPFYPPNLRQLAFRNGSWVDPHFIEVDLPVEQWGSGPVTATGYTDRWGNVQPAGVCTTQGTDCVPFVLEGVPTGYAAFRSDTYKQEHGVDLRVREHDVIVQAGTGAASVLRYPN